MKKSGNIDFVALNAGGDSDGATVFDPDGAAVLEPVELQYFEMTTKRINP